MWLETAEQLRSHAHESAFGGGGGGAVRLSAASGHGAAAQIAWASFVPFLAHPVMAAGAREAMSVIEAASSSEVSLG